MSPPSKVAATVDTASGAETDSDEVQCTNPGGTLSPEASAHALGSNSRSSPAGSPGRLATLSKSVVTRDLAATFILSAEKEPSVVRSGAVVVVEAAPTTPTQMAAERRGSDAFDGTPVTPPLLLRSALRSDGPVDSYCSGSSESDRSGGPAEAQSPPRQVIREFKEFLSDLVRTPDQHRAECLRTAFGLSPCDYYTVVTDHELGLWVGCGFLALVGFGLLCQVEAVDGLLEKNETSFAYCSDKDGNLMSSFIHLNGPPASLKTTLARVTVSILLGASLPQGQPPEVSLMSSGTSGVKRIASLAADCVPHILYLRHQLCKSMAATELGNHLDMLEQSGYSERAEDAELDEMLRDALKLVDTHPIRTKRIQFAFVADEVQALAQGRARPRMPGLLQSLHTMFGNGQLPQPRFQKSSVPFQLKAAVGLAVSNPGPSLGLDPAQTSASYANAIRCVLAACDLNEDDRVPGTVLDDEYRATLSNGRLLDGVADFVFDRSGPSALLESSKVARLKNNLIQVTWTHAGREMRLRLAQGIYQTSDQDGLQRRVTVQPMIFFLTTARDSISCGLSFYLRSVARGWSAVKGAHVDVCRLAENMMQAPDMQGLFPEDIDLHTLMPAMREELGRLGIQDGEALFSAATVKKGSGANPLEPRLFVQAVAGAGLLGQVCLDLSYPRTTDLIRRIGNIPIERPQPVVSLAAYLGPKLKAQLAKHRTGSPATGATGTKKWSFTGAAAAAQGMVGSPVSVGDQAGLMVGGGALLGSPLGMACQCCHNTAKAISLFGLCQSCAGAVGKKDSLAILFLAAHENHAIIEELRKEDLTVSSIYHCKDMIPGVTGVLRAEMTKVAKEAFLPHMDPDDPSLPARRYRIYSEEVEELLEAVRCEVAVTEKFTMEDARQKFSSQKFNFLWLRLWAWWYQSFKGEVDHVFKQLKRSLEMSRRMRNALRTPNAPAF